MADRFRFNSEEENIRPLLETELLVQSHKLITLLIELSSPALIRQGLDYVKLVSYRWTLLKVLTQPNKTYKPGDHLYILCNFSACFFLMLPSSGRPAQSIKKVFALYPCIKYVWSRNSIVGIVRRLRAGRCGFWIPAGAKILLFSRPSGHYVKPTQSPYQCAPWPLSPWQCVRAMVLGTHIRLLPTLLSGTTPPFPL